MALGGDKGQNFILILQRSFIYQAKAKDELDPKNRFKIVLRPPNGARWRKRSKISMDYEKKILIKILRSTRQI